MKNEKRRYWWIIKVVVILLLLLPFIYFGVSYYVEIILPNKRIENYYYTDAESFDGIVEDFKNLYKENLYMVNFDCDNASLEFKLSYTDENGKNDYSTETVNCTNASFIKELSHLHEKYQKNCEYPVFMRIRASYDKEEKMLLHIAAYNERISTEEYRWYYLVYIEEGYSESNAFLGIDPRFMHLKPFKDNWYTWAKDWPLG